MKGSLIGITRRGITSKKRFLADAIPLTKRVSPDIPKNHWHRLHSGKRTYTCLLGCSSVLTCTGYEPPKQTSMHSSRRTSAAGMQDELRRGINNIMVSDTEAWVKIYNIAFILFFQNSAFLLAQRYHNNSRDYFYLIFF